MNKKHLIIILLIFGVSKTINAQTYKVMTYNIRYDNPNDGENQWSKRKAFLVNQISYNAPVVFGIQEGLHHQVKYIDSTLIDYSFIGVGRDDGKTKGEYSAIFYNKNKLKVLKEGTFWLSDTPDKISVGWDASMERICTYGLFQDDRNKKKFWVFNTHFDHIGDKARKESAKLIIEKVNALNTDKIPVVLMGDFNLLPESEPIQFLSKEMNDTRKVSKSQTIDVEGTFNRFDDNAPLTHRIDYVFISKDNIQVNHYMVLNEKKNGVFLSDHLPVIVEVSF